jgi:hypothetical protein
VHTIQDRTFEVRNMALEALVSLIGDIKAAASPGTDGARGGRGAAASAPRPVSAGFRRGRELDGIPCGPGGGPSPRDVAGRGAQGPGGARGGPAFAASLSRDATRYLTCSGPEP